jgi:hypothetical protein
MHGPAYSKGLILILFNSHRKKCITGIVSFGLCFFLQCVFNNQINEQPLTITSLTANGDTLSVFPKLRFAFSSPLADSSVPPKVLLSPSVSTGFGAYLNARNDTLTIDFMEMLEGNTKYVLKIASPVTSISGSVWDLSADSIVFYTFPGEKEANDTKDLADSLTSVIFGSVSDVSDIDVFVCAEEKIKAVFLQSIGCQDSFFIEDGLSNIISSPGPLRQTDTILLPEKTASPIFIFVRSGIKGFEGVYQLGIIEK